MLRTAASDIENDIVFPGVEPFHDLYLQLGHE
jgi:hypothetical protein